MLRRVSKNNKRNTGSVITTRQEITMINVASLLLAGTLALSAVTQVSVAGDSSLILMCSHGNAETAARLWLAVAAERLVKLQLQQPAQIKVPYLSVREFQRVNAPIPALQLTTVVSAEGVPLAGHTIVEPSIPHYIALNGCLPFSGSLSAVHVSRSLSQRPLMVALPTSVDADIKV